MDLDIMTTGPKQSGLRIELRECPAPRKLSQSMLNSSLLEDGEIHLWHASPDMHSSDLDLSRLLSADELARMFRFRFESDQRSFLFCRGMLRMLLASYLGTSPAELRFAYSAHGKPSLAAPFGDLEFNLSHTAGLALFGICRGRRIGLDVEHIRKDFNVMEIAGRFFSSAEKLALAGMPETSKYDAFFHCWTRKEAFVKAQGEGLIRPLDSFDVSISPQDERVSLTTRPYTAEAWQWKLQSLNFSPKYAAAMAIEISNEQ
jgi:4'-phosphopantetheinyl transferase